MSPERGITGHVAAAPHELRANLAYDQHDDAPYWTLRKLIREIGGGETFEIDVYGEDWQVSVSYQESGIAPRERDHVEKLHEYRINAYPVAEDDRRKLPLLIQPRFERDQMKTRDGGEQIQVPKDLGEAVNVKVENAVNIPPDHVQELPGLILTKICDQVGMTWNPNYLRGRPHRYSSITTYECYVRLERDLAKKLVRRTGPMHRIFELTARHEGSKVEYSADNTKTIGYIHQLRMDSAAASELFSVAPGPRRGVQLKHYHPKHVHGDDADPLYHPKFGALFKKSWNRAAVPWHKRRDLHRELEEDLINVLSWASIPTRPGPTYIEDDHFEPTESELSIQVYDDPTPDIEVSQDAVLVRTLRDLTDSDVDVLETLVATDGGPKHVGEIAEEAGWSNSTIYRALRRLQGLIENDNGSVRVVSRKLQQDLQEVLAVADEAVQSAATAAAKVLDMDPRQINRQSSAFQRWLNKYAVDILEDDSAYGDQVRIRVEAICSRLGTGYRERLYDVLEEGLSAWTRSGRDPERFRRAIVEYNTGNGYNEAGIGAAMQRDGFGPH